MLQPILCQPDFKSLKLTNTLKEICQADFEKRTKRKPKPPKTWKRAVPKNKDYYEDVWEMLRPFLESPTEQVFEFRRKQSERDSVMSAISGVTIDLRMETIRRGSPHTLKITKTQTAYDKKLKEWKEDVALLEQLLR